MSENNKKKMVNPWEKKEEVFIYKANRTEQDTQYVAINGRGFYVPKGKTQMAPAPVAEVLRNASLARDNVENEAKEDFGGDALPKGLGIPDNKIV